MALGTLEAEEGSIGELPAFTSGALRQVSDHLRQLPVGTGSLIYKSGPLKIQRSRSEPALAFGERSAPGATHSQVFGSVSSSMPVLEEGIQLWVVSDRTFKETLPLGSGDCRQIPPASSSSPWTTESFLLTHLLLLLGNFLERTLVQLVEVVRKGRTRRGLYCLQGERD